MIFRSGKKYTHSVGLSCAFRQWRAKESHCRFIHGYSLQVELEFVAATLDERNWVQDFGGLKPIKEMLTLMFDHKLLVAQDDPLWGLFKEMEEQGLCELTLVEHVGCEAFARLIYEQVQQQLRASRAYHAMLDCVVVREHEGNWASYGRRNG